MNNVARFPFERTVEAPSNDPRIEFMLDVLDHLPPARAKRIILRARHEDIDFISDQQAQVLLGALGLKEA